MDPHSTSFIGKSQPSRSNIALKSKYTAKESHISRENRVFGTVRSTNVAATTEKQMAKTSKPKPTKPKNHVKNPIKSRFKGEIQKPVVSPFAIKSELVETPYYSARKSGFDRLETASYWIDQIKLAESVGKHFLSVAFFRLALDSNAKPKRKLCFELRQYLWRHKQLASQMEWEDVSFAYGILKDKSKMEKSDCDDFDEDNKELNVKNG